MHFGTIREKNVESCRDRMSICSLGWLGRSEKNQGRHRVAFCSAWFLGSIFGQSMLTFPKWPRCSLLSLWFGSFLWPMRLWFLFQVLQHLNLSVCFSGLTPHALCHVSLCTPISGLKCFALSCWQMPNKCHMQSLSGSVLHRGGWQWSPCFHPVWGTRGRTIWASCQQRC